MMMSLGKVLKSCQGLARYEGQISNASRTGGARDTGSHVRTNQNGDRRRVDRTEQTEGWILRWCSEWRYWKRKTQGKLIPVIGKMRLSLVRLDKQRD